MLSSIVSERYQQTSSFVIWYKFHCCSSMRRGFVVYWYGRGRCPPCPCGINGGTISSPGYPNDYRSMGLFSCSYKFSTDGGQKIQFTLAKGTNFVNPRGRNADGIDVSKFPEGILYKKSKRAFSWALHPIDGYLEN